MYVCTEYERIEPSYSTSVRTLGTQESDDMSTIVGTGEERTSRGLDLSDQIRTVCIILVVYGSVPNAERDGVLLVVARLGSR
jgi:hypothetical protein